ncbi:MAG: AsmA family protein [Alphaproteobacteria bacterium]
MSGLSRPIIIAASIAAVIVMTLGGVAAYLLIKPLDLSDFRPEIAAELQAATGREVKIDGKVTLGVSLRPTLIVEGLEIANQKWGRAKKFITIGRTKIRVHLFPLLRGRADIISIKAEHAVVHLEVDGVARRNWTLLAQAVTAEGEEAQIPEIEEITVSDISLDYRDIVDPGVRHSVILEKASLIHDTVNGIGSYTISGKLGGHSVKADGKIAPLYTISAEQPRQFDMKAQAFGMTLDADGSVKFPFIEFTYSDFTLEAPKGLTQAGDYFGVSLPNIGAIKISGNLTPVEYDLHFGNLDASMGDIKTAGFVIVGLGAPLKVKSDLRSEALDIEPYWNMLPASVPPPGKIFFADPIKLDLPEGVELQFRYAVKSLDMGDHKYSNFLLDGQVDNKVLRLNHMDMDFADGRMTNTVTLKPLPDALSLSIQSNVTGADINKLLKQFDMPKYASGKAFLLLQGESKGPTLAALAAGFDGRAYFEIQEGAIPQRLSSLIRGGITDVFRSIKGMFDGGGNDAKIACGFGAFVINNGIAENRGLLMVTDKAVLTGTGHVDLGQERLKLRLSPRPRDNSLISLASDVDISGTLVYPEFHLNSGSVAKNVGKTALGVALGPLGMILGAAGSIISKPGNRANSTQCAPAKAAAVKSLQESGEWPELKQIGPGQ